jgi:hypothetical protein
MKNEITEVSGLTDIIEVDDDESLDDDLVVQRRTSSSPSQSEAFGATPLEDRYGRHLWIRTRLCFCPYDAPTDCRFHPVTKQGWENCPHLPAAQSNHSLKGRWLWARNPLYGKPLTEEEQLETKKAA